MKTSNSDFSGFDRVNRETRIADLRRQLGELSGGKFIGGTAPDCDPAVEEAFLKHVLALETGPWTKPFDAMIESGLVLPPPEELDNTVLTVKLWELIRALAAKRLYLHCTDHLSDRELYTWLWADALRQEVMGFDLPHGDCHLDVLGGCSEEDLFLSMRFYADDEERKRWAIQWPDFPMPRKEKPPFDRDRHLPEPDYPY